MSMKVRTVVIALTLGFAVATPAFADSDCEGVRSAASTKLSVQVTGVRSTKGEVALTVYPNIKQRFLAKGGKLARIRTKAQLVTNACFWVPQGTYAIAIYHDSNGDHDFNRTLVGLPAEGFGFSNNPETKVGLPPLSAVRFQVGPTERSIAIQMRYLR
jgi:uncharacterized protein (DUF2141 family)